MKHEDSLLELTDVNSGYGQVHVLFDVSLTVPNGSIVALVGRNGAGKTTTLKTTMGKLEPLSGEIQFEGNRLNGLDPSEISQRGIAFVPETRRIFPHLTVAENLRIGHLGHDVDSPDFDTIFEYFPRLEERMTQEAGQMSGGEQQMLTIARALVSDPDLLLVDEPTEGLMPTLVEDLAEILEQINRDGTTILLVEQNIDMALSLSDYVYVIDEGRIQFSDESDVLVKDEELKERHFAL